MAPLLARLTRRTTLGHIRFVSPVPPAGASRPVAAVYDQVEAEFGMLAPPMALHAPAPPILAASWAMLRETLLVTARVSRPAKEVVAAAVSAANTCPYCVDVHSATLTGLVGGADPGAVADGRLDDVRDPALRALAGWAATGCGAGNRRLPFPAPEGPELIGVAVTFEYLNRMVNVFLTDSPLPPSPSSVRAVLRRGAARLMGRLARTRLAPGGSLGSLPPAPLPGDLRWAAGQPHIAAAMGAAAAQIEAAGRRSVPARVRELVVDEVRLGAELPASPAAAGGWIEERVAGLPASERAAGRLALTIALASYRVTVRAVADFRHEGNGDAAIIELAAWASMTAARRIGAELAGIAPRTG